MKYNVKVSNRWYAFLNPNKEYDLNGCKEYSFDIEKDAKNFAKKFNPSCVEIIAINE